MSKHKIGGRRITTWRATDNVAVEEYIQLTKIADYKSLGRRFSWGRIDFAHLKDLSDHTKQRPIPPSMARYRNLYGVEWLQMEKNAKDGADYRCADCGHTFNKSDLHTHHIRSISTWIKNREDAYADEHECFGVLTKRPWHTEDNLVVLCKWHHAERHPHMNVLEPYPY